MVLSIAADPVPIRVNAEGVALVGDTRVPLDTVVHAFERGAAPRTIVRKFPTLRLPDVYAVVAYYLRHKDEVDAYLRERREIAAEARRQRAPLPTRCVAGALGQASVRALTRAPSRRRRELR